MEKTLLLVVLLTSMLIHTDSKKSADADDAVGLLRFKHSVEDPKATLAGWNANTSSFYCRWNGVSCSSTGRVIGLNLQFRSLSGAFPFSAVQELSELRNLSVSGNNFKGSVISTKPSVGTFKCSLEYLDLSSNALRTNEIFNILDQCKGLKSLNLSRNRIQSSVPLSVFENCGKSLQTLDLSHNQLTGRLPREMVNMCSGLEELSLAFNNFSGAFPSLDWSKSNIRKLNLSSNKFSALEFRKSTSLEELDISSNAFSGPFSEVFGNKSLDTLFDSLTVLDASHNDFTGDIPAALPASLRILSLSSNKFTNRNLSGICSASSALQELIIANNWLNGSVLSDLACTSLKVLDLSFNSVGGLIPTDLCNRLPNLEHLLVWSNKLQGSIPETIGECNNLLTMILSYNNLQGSIPSRISDLKNLEWLILSSNNLSGNIPAALGQLNRLVVLAASNNSLQGEIPGELSSCEKLGWVDLNTNSLSGRIPAHIGRTKPGPIVYFSAFKLVFDVNAAHRCKGKRSIDEIFPLLGISLSEFQTKPIVCGRRLYTYQGIFPNIDTLVLLDLSSNRLTGSIPSEIGGMRSLLELNLAHNLLTGEIPLSLGLHKLDTLDLSENMLEGRIPDSIAQLTFLSDFNVSFNNLSGRIPQAGQLTTFPLSSYEGNVGLCGLPLASLCNTTTPISVGQSSDDDDNDDDDDDRDLILVASVVGAVFFILSSTTTFFWGFWKVWFNKLYVHCCKG